MKESDKMFGTLRYYGTRTNDKERYRPVFTLCIVNSKPQLSCSRLFRDQTAEGKLHGVINRNIIKLKTSSRIHVYGR